MHTDDVVARAREYLATLDEFREIGPARWLNLKGAARRAVFKKRRTALRAAEAALRAAVDHRKD